jgi:hypothetical protein
MEEFKHDLDQDDFHEKFYAKSVEDGSFKKHNTYCTDPAFWVIIIEMMADINIDNISSTFAIEDQVEYFDNVLNTWEKGIIKSLPITNQSLEYHVQNSKCESLECKLLLTTANLIRRQVNPIKGEILSIIRSRFEPLLPKSLTPYIFK